MTAKAASTGNATGRDTNGQGHDDRHDQPVVAEPHATLRNMATGILRLNGFNKIREATEWICRDRTRALPLLVT